MKEGDTSMKRIARATALFIFIGAAAAHVGAQGSNTGQPAVRQRPEPATQTKARGQQQQQAAPVQGAANCSGRPGARCAKKGGAKKLRTIF